MSQACLKDYFMAVNQDANMAANEDTATPHRTRSRHRTRTRNDRDFVAIVCKLILATDAKQRWTGMMNWHKLLKADATR